MAKLLGLTQAQHKRVGKVVRDAERLDPNATRAKLPIGDTSARFWASLVAADPSNPGWYSWKKMWIKSPADGTFIESDPPVESSAFSAREANLRPGLAADVKVELTFCGYDEDGNDSYVFSVASPGFFPVRVELTHGVNGTNNTIASYRYTIRPISYIGQGYIPSGEEDPILGTNLPQRKPRARGRVVTQYDLNGDLGVGVAFYDFNGAIELYDAGEVPDTWYCSQLQSGAIDESGA